MISTATIRSIPLDDEAGVRTWHRAARATHDRDRPDAPFWHEDEAVALLREDDPEERCYLFTTEDAAGTVTGTGIVFVPLLDNLEKLYFGITVVPGHRGRGFGDVLVENVAGIAAAEGRTVLVGEGHLPVHHDADDPVRRFAERHGFTLANTEVRRTLQLPVPDATIRGWTDEAARHHDGYELATYENDVPEPLRPSFVELRNQLAVDAPTGDIDFEAGGLTVELHEEQTRRLVETGRRLLITVAVRDGAAVAHSTLSVPPRDTELPHLNQWGTYVHRDHRGHRLGLAVKATNLRAVQAVFPERTLVSTTNSPVNGPMVAINELMGFRPADVFAEFLRRT